MALGAEDAVTDATKNVVHHDRETAQFLFAGDNLRDACPATPPSASVLSKPARGAHAPIDRSDRLGEVVTPPRRRDPSLHKGPGPGDETGQRRQKRVPHSMRTREARPIGIDAGS